MELGEEDTKSVKLGLYWNNGKENGKQNGNYYIDYTVVSIFFLPTDLQLPQVRVKIEVHRRLTAV